MHPKFAAVADSLHDSYERLVAKAPIQADHIWPKEKVRGVYLFSEFGRHLYVGRTNDFRGRYGRHCKPGATHRMAAFAFRLAREATGNLKATYKPGEGSRNALASNPDFMDAFQKAKARIRAMQFRWVVEPDPVRQCLLEVYCAVVLETPYNDFDNH
jgi:hypothetical protein